MHLADQHTARIRGYVINHMHKATLLPVLLIIDDLATEQWNLASHDVVCLI
jgi:hypothetical protein